MFRDYAVSWESITGLEATLVCFGRYFLNFDKGIELVRKELEGALNKLVMVVEVSPITSPQKAPENKKTSNDFIALKRLLTRYSLPLLP